MAIWRSLILYYRLFFSYLNSNKGIESIVETNLDRRILIHIYSLVLSVRLFSLPHYRASSYGDDLRANLRNVAIPLTGLPLSIFCYHKVIFLFFLIFIYPIWALIGAIYLFNYDIRKKSISEHFEEQLLKPNHWFVLWRINCTLVAYHAYKRAKQTKEQYNMEDKGRFLIEGKRLGVPVTPILELPKIMIKHKSIEGGMGIHIYENFIVNNGDWIIQKVFSNSNFIEQLISSDAPLSTVRIITARSASSSSVKVLTIVFRAGRAGQKTDHTAIFFNIDLQSHRLSVGTTNRHWYQLGLNSINTKPMWEEQNYYQHPDTFKQLEGVKWPNVDEMCKCVCKAHEQLCSDIPLIGWDVAWTNDNDQLMLLELNISCNFFNGHFNTKDYEQFCYDWFQKLDSEEINR